MIDASRFVFVPNVTDWTPPPGLVVRVSSRLRGKRALFGVLRKQLKFPDYFGGNWDALHDCLQDLSWLGPVDRVILIHDGLPFGPAATRSRGIYLQLLQGLVTGESPTGPRWTIVFPQAAYAQIERATADEVEG